MKKLILTIAGLIILQFFTAAECPVYFLAKNVSTKESFVVPLTKPDHIAIAREDLITTPPRQRIMQAKLIQGTDGLNRDYGRLGAPAWSWHVGEVIEFGDLYLENLFNPSAIEEHGVEAYLRESGHQVPVGSVVFMMEFFRPLCVEYIIVGQQLVLTWPAQASDDEYMVEGTNSLENPVWSPLLPRPIRENGASLPLGQYKFYRVKSQRLTAP